jgi:hypothetical protein
MYFLCRPDPHKHKPYDPPWRHSHLQSSIILPFATATPSSTRCSCSHCSFSRLLPSIRHQNPPSSSHYDASMNHEHLSIYFIVAAAEERCKCKCIIASICTCNWTMATAVESEISKSMWWKWMTIGWNWLCDWLFSNWVLEMEDGVLSPLQKRLMNNARPPLS